MSETIGEPGNVFEAITGFAFMFLYFQLIFSFARSTFVGLRTKASQCMMKRKTTDFLVCPATAENSGGLHQKKVSCMKIYRDIERCRAFE